LHLPATALAAVVLYTASSRTTACVLEHITSTNPGAGGGVQLKRKKSCRLAALAEKGARLRLAETSMVGTGHPLAFVCTLSLATTTVRSA
jgi:hypothetical protein